ncbi:oligosaccharide flippase family protein, partial [Enterobacteriaceae bacterium RIT714]|nr:oligosaccharide flippase family protein [Enterobacteriaceae bacterium RIT714]
MISKFIREIIIFLFVSGLSRLLPFLLTPIFTHYLAPQDMGQLELVLSLYNIFMVFGMCQLDTSLQRYYHLSPCIPKATLMGVIKLSVLTTIIFFITIPLSVNVLSLGENAYTILLIAGGSILFANLHIINSLIIRYSRPIKYVIVVNALQTTLFATLAYVAIVKFNSGVQGYFLALLVSYVITVLLSALITKEQWVLSINKEDAGKIWSFALPQMPARIASVVAQYGNRFVLFTIFSQTTIGIFAVASKISTLMLVGLSAFCMVWYPLLYDKHQDAARKDVTLIFKLIITIMPVVVLALFALSAFIFKFYISKEYIQAELPTYIMIVA